MKSVTISFVTFLVASTAVFAQNEATASYEVSSRKMIAYDQETNHLMMRGYNVAGESQRQRTVVPMVVNNDSGDEHLIRVEAPTQTGTRAHFTIENAAGVRVYSEQVTPDVNANAVLVLDSEKHCLSRGTYKVIVETSQGRGSTPVTVTE